MKTYRKVVPLPRFELNSIPTELSVGCRENHLKQQNKHFSYVREEIYHM